ncbi:helix-turn-helix domain-containing protein [Pseudomaricurvus alkylphenolicus]|jgi:transcriptional regulator with XRE-family HTH domain|uniref:helix-turn-helix domain-containing protein n=1 Tax=Pseudomaricurvus alkylphenolicus TaxID=1306991 RepID=UPI00141E3CCC|nr:helix-turn-helix domain-containing protein [Pseudomaricurvus alkylphenolicus]NIB43858.1 helix-turn-helix domain-containing protein [Pseudomaricurvus alkylphenolicus]
MPDAVGQRLKSIREFHGWSQRELAKRAGVPNSAISVIEQGSVSPSIQSLEKVLRGFPISLSDFFSITPGTHPCRISRTEVASETDPLIAQLHADSEFPDHPLTLRAHHSEQSPHTSMARFDTLILVTAGEIEFHSLGINERLQRGQSVSISAPSPYRVMPLVSEARWVVVTRS